MKTKSQKSATRAVALASAIASLALACEPTAEPDPADAGAGDVGEMLDADVDARSDVYSLGCVLYEILTGEPPFTGDSPVAVAYQHVREDPIPPSRRHEGISADLDAVVLKALAKNPDNRYQTAAEMRADLVRVHNGEPPEAPKVLTDADRTSFLATGGNAPGPRTDPLPRQPLRHIDDGNGGSVGRWIGQSTACGTAF